MIKTPSKFLSRKFLRGLEDARHISPNGIEYCADEVKDLLLEKETRLAHREFDDELKRKAQEWNHWKEITDFQTSLLQGLKSQHHARECDEQKSVSTVYAPSFCCANTIFPLKERPTNSFMASQQRGKQPTGGQGENPGRLQNMNEEQHEGAVMRVYKGHKVLSQKQVTKKEVEKLILQCERTIEKIKNG